MQDHSITPVAPLSLAAQSVENQIENEIPEYVRQQAADLACGRCSVIGEVSLSWSPNNRSWRADCAACGRYIKFVPTKPPEEREAARQRGIERWMATQPPSEEQLAQLRRCGMSSRPATMLEVSRLIDVLKRGGAA